MAMSRAFITNYRTTTIAALIMAQLIIAAIVFAVAWVGLRRNITAHDLLLLVVVSGGLLEVLVLPFVIDWLLKPLHVLTQAILHVSDQVSDSPPPNVNDKQSEKSGLKALVQTVYQLAAVTRTNATNPLSAPAVSIAAPLLDQLPIGVLAFDKNHKFVFANSKGRAVLPPDQDLSRYGIENLHLLFPQQDTIEHWMGSISSEKIQDTRTWQRIADQVPGTANRRIFDVVAYYNQNESHNIEIILVLIDRTVEYSSDDEAMDFIALAAHELRGPITVIRGYLDTIEDELGPQLNNDQRMLIERLLVSSGQLSGYINNILNVARYDRNHLRLHLREESWPALVKSFTPDFLQRAHAHNRQLSIQIPEDLPTVAADASSIQEVITNLIDNAIKYSHDGGQVVVTAHQDGDFIETTVQDFGIGIPESITPHLFTKFYRSHRSRQAVSGTGLGLYLCKAIMESHGGSIWVRSREGEGTTIGFRIPTYSSVADKLKNDDNSNQDVISQSAHGWIKNHSYYRR